MEIPIEAPVNVKRDIARKLQRSGALRRIETKIKLGMMVAVEEIREPPKDKSALERHRFKDASPLELSGLQSIYSFLAERGLTYTLSALSEESCVRRTNSERLALVDLVQGSGPKRQSGRAPIGDREEEVGEGLRGRSGQRSGRRTVGRNRGLVDDDL
jgi:hypothetical protein